MHDDGPRYEQLLATTLKVPALFILTLLVTFPSLYVFNALVGSRLNVAAVLRLLIASLGVNLAVLASLGTIVAFFSVSTPNYGFMVLLNVVVFAVAGLVGLELSTADVAPAVGGAAVRRATAPLARCGCTLPSGSTGPLADDATQELETIAVEAVEEAAPTCAAPTVPQRRHAWRRTARRLGPSRSAGHLGAGQGCVPLLGDRVRPGGRADGLGSAAVYRRSRQGLYVVPPARFELPASRVERVSGDVFLNGLRVRVSELRVPNMTSFLLTADDILRRARWTTQSPRPFAALGMLVATICVFGLLYGGVMGTFGGVLGDRAWQVLYSAVKVPLLLLATFAISLPSFFVLNTLFGLRRDLGEAIRALVATQAGVAIVLASLRR